jgi:MoxR-like ATPase
MMDELNTLALLRARDQARALLATVRNSMIEVEQPARWALVALLADGHLLLEDVPGVGKTTLARIIARTIGGHDSRIQCTADLSPRDVIGQEIASDNPALRGNTFDPGPLFANAVVMDEINRATPMLQSALFEAMEERFVTVAKRRHPLPKPFFVVATMNPHESEETYHLPFGQRDRFALCTGIGYPSANGEIDLLSRFGRYDALADIDPIVAPGDVVKVQRSVSLVDVPDAIRNYLVQLVRETRAHPAVAVGASPRAALSLQRCCQALALLEDSASVVPRHVEELFVVCLAHRIQARSGHQPRDICNEILRSIRAPQWDERPAAASPAIDPELLEGLSADLPGVSRLERRYAN